MRAFWRRDKPLDSHAQWRGKLGKNSKQGTSAPTLAAVWAGPSSSWARCDRPAFEGLRLTPSRRRRSRPSTSSPVREITTLSRAASSPTASASSSASRPRRERASAQPSSSRPRRRSRQAVAEKDGKTSNAPERLKGLLERFVGYPPVEPRVQDLRYQLLTALAGTLSEAEEQGAQHAVLMVHDSSPTSAPTRRSSASTTGTCTTS